MFFALHTTWQFILLAFGLTAFAFLAWKKLEIATALAIFFLPLYLLKIATLPLTVLEILILIVVVVFFLKPGQKIQLVGREYLIPVTLILAGVFLSCIFSADLKISLGIFKSWFLEPFLFAFVLANIIKEKKQIDCLLSFAVFSGVVVSLVSLGYFMAGKLTFDGRLAAFYFSPNYLAMYLAPCFLVALYLAIAQNKFWAKIVYSTGAFLMFWAVYFTFSYGAWVAIFIAGGFWLLVDWQKKFLKRSFGFKKSFALGIFGASKKTIISTVFIFLLLVIIIISQWQGVKLNNWLNSDRSSWQSRLMIWRAADRILIDHPLVGIGPGLFQKNYLEYQKYFSPYLEWAVPQPHNLFLAFWLETGILGLAGFLWLLIIFFRDNRLARQRFVAGEAGGQAGQNKNRPLALVLGAVIVYILVHGLVDTPYWKNDLALIFWLIIALNYKVARLFD